jgi:hypothetical protein
LCHLVNDAQSISQSTKDEREYATNLDSRSQQAPRRIRTISVVQEDPYQSDRLQMFYRMNSHEIPHP